MARRTGRKVGEQEKMMVGAAVAAVAAYYFYKNVVGFPGLAGCVGCASGYGEPKLYDDEGDRVFETSRQNQRDWRRTVRAARKAAHRARRLRRKFGLNSSVYDDGSVDPGPGIYNGIGEPF